MKLRLQFIILAFIALVIYIPVAHGQARLTFSGGNGTLLTTTLQTAVTYTIINANCASGANLAPFFNFDEVGNVLLSSRDVTGTISFSISGGASRPITVEGSGFIGGDTTANDLALSGSSPTNVANGATVVLSAGTVTTKTAVAAAPPASGSYITFITNDAGMRCSTNGVSLAPTAASVSISGRVITSSGRGLANALVYLTDSEGNTRTARTKSFGYYRFEDVQAGQTAIVTVASKRYQFDPKVINLTEDLSELDFIAQ